MASFNTTMVPDSVTSFEKLIVWAFAVMNATAKGLIIQERDVNLNSGDTGQQQVFQMIGPIFSAKGDDRLICRFSCRMKPDHNSPNYSGKWAAVEDEVVSTAAEAFLKPGYTP